MGKCNWKNKLNAYVYTKRGINKCVNTLYCNLCTVKCILNRGCSVNKIKNRKK